VSPSRVIARRACRSVALFVLVLLLSAGGVWAGTPLEDLRKLDPSRHIRKISEGSQSRYTGYPGSEKAADYIQKQFQDMGLTGVESAEIEIVSPLPPKGADGRRPDAGGRLTIGDVSLPLYCVMPNLARTCSTEPDGLTGRIIWGGDGYLRDFNGKDVAGSIVVMKFNSMSRWLNAARLGAVAVIFLEPDAAFRTDAEQKFSNLPIPMPRYYLRKARLPALLRAAGCAAVEGLDGSSTVTVKATIRWEQALVRRISARIPGIDPHLSAQTIVLSAYYDSTSVVPALSPGAESACGVAALLEVARYLTLHPPRRSVKLLVLPGHFQALSGAREYVRTHIYGDRKESEPSDDPYLFIGLDLSSRRNSVGAFFKGYFYDQGDYNSQIKGYMSGFSAQVTEWANQINGKGMPAESLTYQSGIVGESGRTWESLLPDLAAFDAEVVGQCGLPAITLATTGDPRSAVGTPLDTFANMQPAALENVRRQTMACAWLVKHAADEPDLSINRTAIWKKGRVAASLFGFSIEQSLLSFMPKQPVPDALAAINIVRKLQRVKARSMMGVRTTDMSMSNTQGHFEIFGLTLKEGYRVDGFLLAPNSGAVTRIAQPKIVVATDRVREAEWAERETDLRLNFFRSASTTLFDLTDPLSLRTLSWSNCLRGESNSEPEYLVKFVGQESKINGFSKPCAVFFTRQGLNLKFILDYGGPAYSGLLLNFDNEVAEAHTDKREYNGLGYLAEDTENILPLTGWHAARNLHGLDTHRLTRLTAAGIKKNAVERLHNEVTHQLAEADRALADRQYDRFYHHVNMAWGVENRVYPDVHNTATDVVKGVIFYFALLLPFVIFAERLFFGIVDIRKKLAMIAALFFVSFMVLRCVHPAFELSNTPVIILDGFFMLIAAVGTIWYLLAKFTGVMESMRQKVATIHRANVARTAATMAAFVLGTSNMRKRKVRTGLTAATLILLTFTILSFTSFEAVPDSRLDYKADRRAPYEGVLLRSMSWGPLAEFVTADLMNFFRVQNLPVAPRSWFVSRSADRAIEIEVIRDYRPGSAVVNALLGLTPEERHFTNIYEGSEPGSGRPFYSGEPFDRAMKDWPAVCILPTRLSESLGIEAREIAEGTAFVHVLGTRPLRVVGTLNSDAVSRAGDLDGEPITPVDFVAQSAKTVRQNVQVQSKTGALSATGEQSAADFVHGQSQKDEEADQYIHLEPDRILIIPDELCQSLGGSIRSIAAGPGQPSEAEKALRPFHQVINDLLQRVDLAVYAGYTDPKAPRLEADPATGNMVSVPEIHRIATRSAMSVGGMGALIVPIIIAALIVFNTMLGAVYERMNEIRTYASVGLAPVHIAALFFAESCVFAVMGAMIGYLLGQVLNYMLGFLPEAVTASLSLNYSSISAVWSATLVIIVVLASTAYPARMAGKLSVPDETRKMPIPRPTSDVWRIQFPFTVSSREILGVMSYLHEYFLSNDDASIGRFTASQIRMYAEMGERGRDICIDSHIGIAPLDMGVSQHVKIAAVPDEEEGEISYLFFTITRVSGEFQTWHRMNMGFLKDLRKQLLIWRLVTPEAKRELAEEGRQVIDALSATT
jgi:FtsX-like permease family protein/peptidase M28-like protein